MTLAHYNDGKENLQSHEIFLKDEDNFYNRDPEIFSYDLSDIHGYGETEEEALEDFKKKLKWILEKYKEFEKTIFESDISNNNIVEVDCFGKEIK